MNTLALRRLSRSEVRLRQKVGAGWFYPLADDETLGGLTLRLGEPDAAPATALRTGAGTLWLSEAEAVCGVLSRCPTVITPGTEQAWYWPLWNHYLIAGARTLFGTLEPDAQAQPDAGLVWLSLEIELGEAHAASQVGVETATLVPLLNRLVEQGLIERAMTDNDKRKRLLVATPKGEALYHEVRQVADRFREDVLTTITPEELQQVRAVLTRLLQEVQKA